MYYSSGVVKWLFTGSDGAKCKVAQLIVQKEALFAQTKCKYCSSDLY